MRKIKTIICIIIITILSTINFSYVKAADVAKMTLTPTIKDNEVTVKITVSGYTNGISGIMGTITYDKTLLKYKGIAAGGSKWQTPSINTTTGKFTALISSTITENSTEVAIITFERVGTAEANATVGIKEISMSDKDDTEVEIADISIPVTLPKTNTGGTGASGNEGTGGTGASGNAGTTGTGDGTNNGSSQGQQSSNNGNAGNSGTSGTQDKSLANKSITKAGKSDYIIIGIILVAIVAGIVSYRKYKKYRGI